MPSLPIVAMENAPSFVLGIAIVRGTPTPVVDLGALFGAAHTPSPARFVTLRVAERTVALAVSSVLSVQTLDVAALYALPPLMSEVGHAAIEAIGRLDAELLVVLGASRIIPEALLDTLLCAEAISS